MATVKQLEEMILKQQETLNALLQHVKPEGRNIGPVEQDHGKTTGAVTDAEITEMEFKANYGPRVSWDKEAGELIFRVPLAPQHMWKTSSTEKTLLFIRANGIKLADIADTELPREVAAGAFSLNAYVANKLAPSKNGRKQEVDDAFAILRKAGYEVNVK